MTMAPNINQLVPADAWDTHIHVFDPEAFPYGEPRSYTPRPALLSDYPFSTTGCSNIVIVQATVQGKSPEPLLADLANQKSVPPSARLRGLCTIDVSTVSETELDRLHAAGVRGVRMHEISWGHGTQTAASTIADKIRVAAAKVARLGWVVDVFSDIRSWGAMADMIRELPASVKLIADHCGGTYPGEEKLEEFEKFLSLVRDGLLHVKLSGFDRLYPGHDGGMQVMEPIVKAIVEAGPGMIIYGSGMLHTSRHA